MTKPDIRAIRLSPPARARAAGFSMLELLVAMSIFSVISVGIVTLLARVSDFTRSGSSKTETLDALQTFTQTFSRDLSGIQAMGDSDTGAPAVRLYSDVADADVDGDGKADTPARRLFFVKLIPDEAASEATRGAGTALAATGYTDQTNDADEVAKGVQKATGGLMEVFWTALPDSAADPAVCTLYRGYRSPIGGVGSLMPSKSAVEGKTVDERGPLNLPEVKKVAIAALPGVLYFGVDFWARRTETWDSGIAPPKGPLVTWDSTRGIMQRGNVKGGVTDGFFYAKQAAQTGPTSLDDPTDDTFPRRMRVTLVVEEVGGGAIRGALLSPLSADARTMELYDVSFIPAVDTTQQFVKVGSEWIQFEGVEGATLTGLRRGQRGTKAQRHDEGRLVHYGRTVVREFNIATFRDAYKDELPAVTDRR